MTGKVKYYTYRRNVPKPGPRQRIDFRKGHGYFLTRKVPDVHDQHHDPPPPAAVFVPVMFTAWDPLAVLTHPWSGRVAVSADPSYREAVEAALPVLHDHHFIIGTWADCDKTPAHDAMMLARDHELPFWIGQAESRAQARDALSWGAPEIIGNAASLLIADANGSSKLGPEGDEIIQRKVVFYQEAYWRDSQGPPSKVSAYGIPARLCPGLYGPCPDADAYVSDLPALGLDGGPLGAVYLAEGGRDWTPFNV